MDRPRPEDVTLLLKRIDEGDSEAAASLIPLVYGELKALAGFFFSSQPANHTLQPTALVHEAWIKIGAGGGLGGVSNRRHFFALASRAMRQVLADHAKRLRREKRGGGKSHRTVTFKDEITPDPASAIDVVAFDDALSTLQKLNERHAKVVELRLFGSLTLVEIGETLGVSKTTVVADWNMARAWFLRQLADAG